MLTKIKKELCFLLSTLQIAFLSSCNNKNILEAEYKESLNKIEQLEKDNNSLEENIAKLEQEKKELEQEMIKLKEEFNYQLPINYPNPFNINLAKEINISEELFNNNNLKNYIEEFNTYISSYENVLYNIENKDTITYYVNDECIGKISLSQENNTLINFTCYEVNGSYSNSIVINDNKVVSTDYDASWTYENNNYNMGIIVSNDSYTTYEAYIGYNSILNEEEKLYINLIQNKNYKNTLNINAISPIYVTNNYDHVNIEIEEEDFQKLNNLILTYKDNNKFEDVFSYCRTTILDIIKRYNKENECLPYMDILTGNNIYKESKNLSKEMLIEMGIEETLLNNKDIQNSISQINEYLNNIEGNVNYKISSDFNEITFYLDGKNILHINYSSFDHALSYSLIYDNYTTYIDIVIQDNINTEAINNQINWLFDNTIYLIGTQNFEDGRIIKEVANEDLNILISKNTDSYNITIANNVEDSKKWYININQEYFESLSKMLDDYQNKLDLGNVIAYLKEDLLSIIKDCTYEDEYNEIASLFTPDQILTRS